MSVASVELHVGLELPPRDAIVDAERQRRYHASAEVPEGLFGQTVDLSILANDCILAGYPLRDGRVTNLHMSQRMIQSAPVRLEEPLRLTGRVAELADTGKGQRVRIDLEFTRADGSVPVRAEMTSLQVDRAAMRQKGAGSAKAFETEGFETVALKHATAARVTGYSAEFPLDQVRQELADAPCIGSGTAGPKVISVGHYEVGSGISTATRVVLPTPYAGAEVKVVRAASGSGAVSITFDAAGSGATGVYFNAANARRITLKRPYESFHVVGVSATRWRIQSLDYRSTGASASAGGGASAAVGGT